MLLQVILEGLGLGALLVLICAAGIRKGAVGMVHLYSPAVQQRCVKIGRAHVWNSSHTDSSRMPSSA